jgi:hypothetical protein
LSEGEEDGLLKNIFEILDATKIMSQDEIMVDLISEDEEEDEEVDLEDQRAKTETLRDVLTSVSQLWNSGSQQMDLVVETLADRSRERKSAFFDIKCHLYFLVLFSNERKSISWKSGVSIRYLKHLCSQVFLLTVFSMLADTAWRLWNP